MEDYKHYMIHTSNIFQQLGGLDYLRSTEADRGLLAAAEGILLLATAQ